MSLVIGKMMVRGEGRGGNVYWVSRSVIYRTAGRSPWPVHFRERH